MYLGDESAKKRTQRLRWISGILILLFLISFWQDIIIVLGLLKDFLLGVILGNLRLDELIPPTSWKSIWVLSYN